MEYVALLSDDCHFVKTIPIKVKHAETLCLYSPSGLLILHVIQGVHIL